MPRTALLAIAVALLVASVAPKGQAPSPSRPNIILIQADDLGYGDLSAYGQTQFQTPALDRLAAEGTRFTQYYSGSTVCAPSRAALMTGFHTGHVWVRGNGEIPLRDEDTTVAMAVREAGYRTAVIGKWGLGKPGTGGAPDKKGFDHSFGFLDHRHAHRQFTDYLFRNGESVPSDLERDYVNDQFTRDALTFIEKPDPRPFFLYLSYTVPHAELRVPEDSLAPMRGKFGAETPYVNAIADGRPTGPGGPTLGYRSQPTPKAAFAAMITRMDRDIGALVDRLKARGLDQRTLVMFTSDNGPHKEGGADPAFFKSSGGLRGIKRDLYEGGIRVPLIASWPGTIPKGKVSAHPWAHWDMFPTIAEIAGAKAPAGIDGRSMARALRGQSQPAPEYMYWEFHERGFQQAVRMGRWKAVRLSKDAPLEIYDLQADPHEERNVAAAQADVVKKIEDYLRTARTDSAQWPIK